MDNLIFLKLGGSLITDKGRPRTPHVDVLSSLCRQIAEVSARDPNLILLVGHGSGSFGHVAGKKYKTRAGLPPLAPPEGRRTGRVCENGENSPFLLRGQGRMRAEAYWHGFTEVWHEARELNKIVMDSFRDAKIPAIAISPSSGVIAKDGKVAEWNLEPIKHALASGITPVIYGDVVFDEIRGGT
ncbi:MAG TPA: hypothetical protein EYP74_01825, partial [Anaerolineales bacterium]|nr:hypothetical protein [Anaerolineales bacterium]